MITKEADIRFKIAGKEKENLKMKAKRSGLSLSKYIRNALLEDPLNL